MIERLIGEAAAARSVEIASILAESFDDPSQRWSATSVASTLVAPGAVALLVAGGCALIRVVVDEAELLTIAVSPKARRRGVGRRLAEACLAEAAERGATRIYLEVRAGNAPAIGLYEAAGFVVAARRPGYFAGTDGREDALLMSRTIGPAGCCA